MKIFLLNLLFVFIFLNLFAEQNKFVYESKNKRDPFLPLVTETGQIIDLEPKETSVLNLEGIVFDKSGESLAVINGIVLKKGQAFNDYLVFDIKKNEVILIRGSEKITLQLEKELNK
ncbi:MAG: hypothetical protein AB1755_02800 [Candidatus Omnitrophota bacterium]